jgi:FMN phosphatase YigB (HAD superfamily)
MILLLDLDDTLISNHIDTFLSAYLKALGQHMAGYAKPETLIKELLTATQWMVNNTRLDQTLEEVFDAHFYPALGQTKTNLRPALDEFYAQVYPSLKPIISPRPDAIRMVETALEHGHRLVIATNPLFPKTAIQQRMIWGNLSPKQYAFELITSYETLHFAKPNPAYYAEIMAQLGWPNEPVMMVGDDLENDIKPAAQAGLATYWITDQGQSGSSQTSPTTLAGSLDDLIDWLNQNLTESVSTDFSTPEAVKLNLTATPAALFSMTNPLSPDDWTLQPTPGEWSLTEVLCHLRDVENEVNLPRLEKFKVEDNPFFPGIVTDPWAVERQYSLQDGSGALCEFAAARKQTLVDLNQLPAIDWDRETRHAIFGPTPLRELISFIATHDRSHLQQAYQLTKPGHTNL